ncbi:hypothetical protein [Thiohalophilus sp.]|uniref:hypothetical protein n=1 Tax=Thiohalophilus sp. TaxID=3028392 RepID=UPI002ACD2FB6|nr:hypothetical protein [Thiohalophilus sp.]MDZ7805352.1 hypothetical protein [Thiohalophilus sp.]
MPVRQRFSVWRTGGLLLLLCLIGLQIWMPDTLTLPNEISSGNHADWLYDIPESFLVVIFMLAPLLGVPISIFLVVIGIAFPTAIAIVLTGGTIFTHHILVFALTKTNASNWIRNLMRRGKLLSETRAGRRVSDNVLFITITSWIPGLSYIIKLAYTALSGVPFRTYLITGTLSQIISALPFLILGKAVENGNAMWMWLALVLLILLAWLAKYLLIEHRDVAAVKRRSSGD